MDITGVSSVWGTSQKKGVQGRYLPVPPQNLLVMSIPSHLSDWLEEPNQQAQLSALSTATTLPEMVLVALQLGLALARWLLECDLTRRAQTPQAWGNCPHCGRRLQSKGFQPRQQQTLVGLIV